MARHHRELDLRASAPTRTPEPARKEPTQHQNEQKPNAWFAILRLAVSADLELRGELPDLNEDEILAWADAFHSG